MGCGGDALGRGRGLDDHLLPERLQTEADTSTCTRTPPPPDQAVSRASRAEATSSTTTAMCCMLRIRAP